MTGRGPVPSQGSSREGSGPLYPDGHCHQVFQQEDCLFSGAPPSSSPVLFLSTPDQNAEWFYPRAQVGRLRLWRGSHLPQSHGCPRAHVLRALPFPSAPRPSLLGKRNCAFRAGRRRSLGCLRLLWAPRVPPCCPEPHTELGGTGNRDARVCLPGKNRPNSGGLTTDFRTRFCG